MKNFFISMVLIILISGVCFAGNRYLLTINCSGSKTAIVTVTSLASGAKYLGVTAFLSDGRYYDFPAEKVGAFDLGKPMKFTLPGNYSADKFAARLWKGKKKSNSSWSDKVVNPQGYLMTGPIGDAVSCNN